MENNVRILINCFITHEIKIYNMHLAGSKVEIFFKIQLKKKISFILTQPHIHPLHLIYKT
jgi:hypothetical protein